MELALRMVRACVRVFGGAGPLQQLNVFGDPVLANVAGNNIGCLVIFGTVAAECIEGFPRLPVFKDVDPLGHEDVGSNREIEASLGGTRLFNDRCAAREVGVPYGRVYSQYPRDDDCLVITHRYNSNVGRTVTLACPMLVSRRIRMETAAARMHHIARYTPNETGAVRGKVASAMFPIQCIRTAAGTPPRRRSLTSQ